MELFLDYWGPQSQGKVGRRQPQVKARGQPPEAAEGKETDSPPGPPEVRQPDSPLILVQ